MSRIGRMPIAVPYGVQIEVEPIRDRAREGAQGRVVTAAFPRGIQLSRENGELKVSRAERSPPAQGAARPDPHARRQHGDRRHRRASRSGWRSRGWATAPSRGRTAPWWSRSVSRIPVEFLPPPGRPARGRGG